MSRFISYICIFAFLFWNCNNSNKQADYKAIHIYCLENGKYIAQPPIIEGDTVTSIAFPSLSFSTKELFKN